jgi:lysozyme
MATGARSRGKAATPPRDWRSAAVRVLRRIGDALVLVFLLAGLALWWASRWTPSRELFPTQGVTIDASNGEVRWGSIKAAGADFAYVVATAGDKDVDPMFQRNLASARTAGIPVGVIHRYSLCGLATDQAANFIRHVPRRADMMPSVVWLDFDDHCPDRPTRALLRSELATFLAQIEAHMGQESLIAPSAGFEADYGVTGAIFRTAAMRSDFFEPDYGAHPWTMWQANHYLRVSGADGTVGWNVLRPKGEMR